MNFLDISTKNPFSFKLCFSEKSLDINTERHSPVTNFLFKVNNGNIRMMCEICLKLNIKTPERHQWRCSGVFFANFEQILHKVANPANIYLFNINNRNTRKGCEKCSKLTIKIQERRQWRRSGVFFVNLYFTLFSSASIFDFEQVNVC